MAKAPIYAEPELEAMMFADLSASDDEEETEKFHEFVKSVNASDFKLEGFKPELDEDASGGTDSAAA
jgi:hypothetical protein